MHGNPKRIEFMTLGILVPFNYQFICYIELTCNRKHVYSTMSNGSNFWALHCVSSSFDKVWALYSIWRLCYVNLLFYRSMSCTVWISFIQIKVTILLDWKTQFELKGWTSQALATLWSLSSLGRIWALLIHWWLCLHIQNSRIFGGSHFKRVICCEPH